MIFGPLIMILVLAAVIAVAVLLVRWLGGPWPGTASHQVPPGRTALDILKERFARGEIDKESSRSVAVCSATEGSSGQYHRQYQ